MKADRIIKNAKIFTSDKDNPQTTALVVKDGKFVYVGERLEPNGKQEALDIMSKRIKENPGLKRYRFLLEKEFLNGDDIVKEELDAICPDAELQIQEGEGHSIWVNSKILKNL